LAERDRQTITLDKISVDGMDNSLGLLQATPIYDVIFVIIAFTVTT
jgi:hypothetical protein